MRVKTLKECEGDPPPPPSDVLGLSYSFALADTAEAICCDVLNFPPGDSRVANNSIARIGEPKSVPLSGYCWSRFCFLILTSHMVTYLHILEFAFIIVHQEE